MAEATEMGEDMLMIAVEQAEAALPGLLEAQITDPSSPDLGAAFYGETGVPYLPTSLLATAIPLIACHRSRYHRDKQLAQRAQLAAEACLRRQEPDGTISMLDCNFHSPPDTAFVVEALGPALALMRRAGLPELEPASRALETFLARTGPALLTGGIHTPNHRWVMVAALAWLHRLFGDEAFVARAEEWLAEGFDITADGEWTERSNAIYNVVCASALTTAGLLLNRPELFEPVRRNLRRMVYFVHPDGEIVTETSHRQDAGERFSLSRYYRAYRFLAAIDRDPLFAAMADWARALGGTCSLLDELLYPELDAAGVPRAPLPERYAVQFGRAHAYPDLPRVFHYEKPRHRYTPEAPVVRERRSDVSLTVLGEHPHFLSFRAGEARLIGVRVIPAYFGCGPFRFPAIVAEDGRYVLEREWTAWYNGPLPREARIPSGRWAEMDHRRRPLDHSGRLLIRCEIVPRDDGFDLTVSASGPPRCPVQVAFLFDPAGAFEPTPSLQATDDGSFLLIEGSATFSQGRDRLVVSGARSSHRMAVLRGDEPRHGTRNLLINALTPMSETYTVRRAHR
ncbi:MAG TPA: hypothetical protein VF234_00255 [Limnochordia bacterium]